MVALLFLQVAPPQPQDLVTLQWVIITVLASVVLYLFKQLRNAEKSKVELSEKVLTGLGENSEALRGLADAVEAFQQQALLREVERLRYALHERNKKD